MLIIDREVDWAEFCDKSGGSNLYLLTGSADSDIRPDIIVNKTSCVSSIYQIGLG